MDIFNQYYFDWLCGEVGAGPEMIYQNRRKLLVYLYNKPFWYSNKMDENRFIDAEDMCAEFEDTEGFRTGHAPCCLDVMVALCKRIDHDIMGTGDIMEKARWFTDMLKSLELYNMTDQYFDAEQADILVDMWLRGDKSLFIGPDYIKKFDIWYQAQYYLNELLERR